MLCAEFFIVDFEGGGTLAEAGFMVVRIGFISILTSLRFLRFNRRGVMEQSLTVTGILHSLHLLHFLYPIVNRV